MCCVAHAHKTLHTRLSLCVLCLYTQQRTHARAYLCVLRTHALLHTRTHALAYNARTTGVQRSVYNVRYMQRTTQHGVRTPYHTITHAHNKARTICTRTRTCTHAQQCTHAPSAHTPCTRLTRTHHACHARTRARTNESQMCTYNHVRVHTHKHVYTLTFVYTHDTPTDVTHVRQYKNSFDVCQICQS